MPGAPNRKDVRERACSRDLQDSCTGSAQKVAHDTCAGVDAGWPIAPYREDVGKRACIKNLQDSAHRAVLKPVLRWCRQAAECCLTGLHRTRGTTDWLQLQLYVDEVQVRASGKLIDLR